MASAIGVAVVGGLTLGALVLMLILLNLRDSRARVARDDVLAPLLSREIVSLAGIRIDAPILSRRVRITLDMTACPQPLLLDVLGRVAPLLPSWVRVQLLGRFGAGVTVVLTAQAVRQPSPERRHRGARHENQRSCGRGVAPHSRAVEAGNAVRFTAGR